MQELTIFNYEHSEIRVFTINDEPCWLVSDLKLPLGYSQSTDTNWLLSNVDEADKVKLTADDLSSSASTASFAGQSSNLVGAWVVNESGLYALIFGSKKEEAKKFKRWVTSEVLPSLRKTGSYQIEKKDDLILSMLSDMNKRMENLTNQMIETNAKYDELKSDKLQLQAENEELTEFKEDVEIYPEFMYLLDVAKNELAVTDYQHGVTCKEYLIQNDIPLSQSAWCTLSRRTASFYRSTKGRSPHKRNGQYIYCSIDVAYIVATIRLIMKGL